MTITATEAEPGVTVRFRVGRIQAAVTPEDAGRLVDYLLARGRPASVSVALKILGAQEAA